MTIDLIFLIDIALSFRTSYEDPQRPGEWVTKAWPIAWHYLSGWFFPDVLGSIPTDLIVVLSQTDVTAQS